MIVVALIAVDMTPVLPGGENGGAKIVALELLLSLRKASPGDEFLILTSSWNHGELSALDGVNMRRLCVLRKERTPSQTEPSRFPSRAERLGRRVYHSLKRRLMPILPARQPLRSRGVDLLFCPFTAPTYFDPAIPLVSVVHDLQHVNYPQFFAPLEIDHRNAFMSDVKRKASAVICVSGYVRDTVLKHLGTQPDRTFAVPNSFQGRLLATESEPSGNRLSELGVAECDYMFYPANFWEHKNHRMLMTAYGMFLSRAKGKTVDLVFTGALSDRRKQLEDDAARMGLSERVHFLGFVDPEAFRAVLGGCRFLVFPSLYEGFGMPVLEAMALGKPVLCSNVTSLPEVAGDAALYFDPRKPEEIAVCIERILSEEPLARRLGEMGRKRSEKFNQAEMTRSYLHIFHQTIRNPSFSSGWVTGVYGDGWTAGEAVFALGGSGKKRVLEIDLQAPAHIPHSFLKLKLTDDCRTLKKMKVGRGERLTIRQALDGGCRTVTLSVSPLFCPADYGENDDVRHLGIMCMDCALVFAGGERRPFLKGGN